MWEFTGGVPLVSEWVAMRKDDIEEEVQDVEDRSDAETDSDNEDNIYEGNIWRANLADTADGRPRDAYWPATLRPDDDWDADPVYNLSPEFHHLAVSDDDDTGDDNHIKMSLQRLPQESLGDFRLRPMRETVLVHDAHQSWLPECDRQQLSLPDAEIKRLQLSTS